MNNAYPALGFLIDGQHIDAICAQDEVDPERESAHPRTSNAIILDGVELRIPAHPIETVADCAQEAVAQSATAGFVPHERLVDVQPRSVSERDS